MRDLRRRQSMGEGRLTARSVGSYQIDMRDGKQHGYGTFTYAFGACYTASGATGALESGTAGGQFSARPQPPAASISPSELHLPGCGSRQ